MEGTINNTRVMLKENTVRKLAEALNGMADEHPQDDVRDAAKEAAQMLTRDADDSAPKYGQGGAAVL